ncbi:RNA/RNP complex-1-interacting phosphatase [Thrips palmi]|uniref:RNA/RNP complex-1-interacting phosphatase n=1 Tax=Thrips palmi TaxID=161013 RepID=A0A6P8YYS7_THRPL|nr:RNA/RNP complex-1-interacting phosphatase [Thrips palmi]
MGKGPSPIPDRWLPYKSVGGVIPGTRFFAFKVPLREEIFRRTGVPQQQWHTIDSLLEEMSKLGLVVDITNTNRYYDPQAFRAKGVAHEKIMCPGHQIPPPYVVKRFFKVVDEYLDQNPEGDGLIGVHCTHGLNRTGYLVCKYMIDRLKWSPENAIEGFNQARGHNIERTNYLSDLHRSRGAAPPQNGVGIQRKNHNRPERIQEQPGSWRARGHLGHPGRGAPRGHHGGHFGGERRHGEGRYNGFGEGHPGGRPGGHHPGGFHPGAHRGRGGPRGGPHFGGNPAGGHPAGGHPHGHGGRGGLRFPGGASSGPYYHRPRPQNAPNPREEAAPAGQHGQQQAASAAPGPVRSRGRGKPKHRAHGPRNSNKPTAV